MKRSDGGEKRWHGRVRSLRLGADQFQVVRIRVLLLWGPYTNVVYWHCWQLLWLMLLLTFERPEV
jgi:hypothetical protein